MIEKKNHPDMGRLVRKNNRKSGGTGKKPAGWTDFGASSAENGYIFGHEVSVDELTIPDRSTPG